MSNNSPSEEYECAALSAWLVSRGIKHTHIPNGMFTRSWAIKHRNKRLGVSAGFPDYAIILNKSIVFIEMKRKTGGRVSVDQVAWIQALRDVGIAARVCYGCDEAIEFLKEIENV